MDQKSLAGRKEACAKWRSKKQHWREAVPVELVEKARKAAVWHGAAAVARATKLGQGRLKVGRRSRRARGRAAARLPVPGFSRVALAVPEAAVRPFAEVETTAGAKLRLLA
ncbi:hypothetical protein ACFL5O_08420 [Myxococcota bacterium]